MVEEKSYINTLLHYNLEFIAGETNTYDKLLHESFDPALDIFLQCPKWHADLEISGLMLEYIDLHFPEITRKVQTLNQRKQCDIVCVHYSETIWPAFPLEDFRRSWAIDRQIMGKLGLAFSPTFFAQENFFGEGIAAVAPEFGIKHANIPEKNYSWPYAPLQPLYPVYDMQGVDLVIRGEDKQDGKWWVFEDPTSKRKIKWTYDKCGDGEPWVGNDPYNAGGLWCNKDKVQHKLALYKTALAEGTQFTTTHEFVEEMGKLGIPKPKLLPVPDGPWGLEKPGVFQWMGLYFSYYELDVELRSLAFRSRAMLLAAETLIELAEVQGINTTQCRAWLARGWRKQVNSEVSDSSGWVPTLVEMYYAVDHALTAFYWGEKICRTLRTHLNLTDEAIDTLTRQVIPKNKIAGSGKSVDLIPEWGVEVVGPRAKVSCSQFAPNVYILNTSFLHTEVDTGVKFAFRDNDALRYSPALMDDQVVDHPLAKYNPACRYLYLPLPNGLINLAPDWWVVKHNDCSHVACTVNFAEKRIEFMTLMNIMAVGGREQLSIELPQNWEFTVVNGPASEALKWATKINLYPTVPANYPAWPTRPEPWIPFTRMVTK